jgi:hypothetical protein
VVSGNFAAQGDDRAQGTHIGEWARFRQALDQPFARIEYVGPDRFSLSYMRHTGAWWAVYHGLSLDEALATMEAEPIFHPTP